MKRIIYLALAVLSSTTLMISCHKIPVGFLSPGIFYTVDPMLVPRGRLYEGVILNQDGSTLPLHVQLLHVYDNATGKIMDSLFFQKFPVTTWTAAFNVKTDTTLALIQAKQKIVDYPGIFVNDKSGQLEGDGAALNIPGGNYSFDLKISNIAGSRIYPKIGHFILVDTTTYDDDNSQYDKLYKVGDENISQFGLKPSVTIVRLADSPNVVMLKIVDKNGVLFNPNANEIIRRPFPGLNPPQPYLQTLQDYSLGTTITDSTMNFQFGVVPFPFVSLGNGFNYYYRIPTQFFHLDGQPDGMWSLNPRLSFQIFVPGTYEVTFQLPDVTHS